MFISLKRCCAFGPLLAMMAPNLAVAGTPTDIPPAFAVGDRQIVSSVQAVGAQIYACTSKPDGSRHWTFREPIASLMQNGTTVGQHYAGPAWRLAESSVTGKATASVPGTTSEDIPSLELQVVDRHGAGPLTEAQIVLRVHTSGGALAGSCERDGDLRSVPYKADYIFLK